MWVTYRYTAYLKHYTGCRIIFAQSKRGYRERVRERENEMESENSLQFGGGSINGPSNRGRVGLTLKLDELLWPLRSYLLIWNICVLIILVLI